MDVREKYARLYDLTIRSSLRYHVAHQSSFEDLFYGRTESSHTTPSLIETLEPGKGDANVSASRLRSVDPVKFETMKKWANG